jgi:hypothetical protein
VARILASSKHERDEAMGKQNQDAIETTVGETEKQAGKAE